MNIITKGIDVSYYQGDIDFAKVKASGVGFVIIRCGITGWGDAKSKKADVRFEEYYAKAKQAGLGVGVYYYSCAETVAEATAEAQLTLQLLEGKQIDYPVWYDVEEPRKLGELTKEQITDIIIAYCTTIEKAGYYCGIYANKNWLDNKMIYDKIKRFDIWLAQWTDKPTYSNPYGIWQYSNNGTIQGINERVDLNYAYKDYPSIIKSNGLNGYTKGQNQATQPTTPTQTTTKPTYKNYTIKKGDSWWKIAQQQMGSGSKCTQLAKYNGKTIFTTIHPGQTLKIPL